MLTLASYRGAVQGGLPLFFDNVAVLWNKQDFFKRLLLKKRKTGAVLPQFLLIIFHFFQNNEIKNSIYQYIYEGGDIWIAIFR
jgi:hypothetical protein